MTTTPQDTNNDTLITTPRGKYIYDADFDIYVKYKEPTPLTYWDTWSPFYITILLVIICWALSVS